MPARSPHLEDAEAIRMALQRVCREGGELELHHPPFTRGFPLLAEDGEALFVGMTPVEAGQWGLKAGQKLRMRVVDRGRVYEAITPLEGQGRLEGEPCVRLGVPRLLTCLDAHRFADWVPSKPLACTYTTPGLDILDGFLHALGEDGVELEARRPGSRTGAELRLGADTVVSLGAGELKLVLDAVVAHRGDHDLGLRWKAANTSAMLSSYRAWLQDRLREQARLDREGFDPEGSRGGVASRDSGETGLDLVKLWVDRDPMVLVVAEGDALPGHLAQSLGRKLGFASLDQVRGRVAPRLGPLGAEEGGWGRVRLILVHQRLRVGSGLELTHQLVQEERCPLPILIGGTEEDVTLKRNRAIAAGAVDFIAVEPFHVLSLLRTLEETLRLFG
ncbi:MAG: hypothetical protein BWY56_00247 [Acidobacteria bacterium ADurb.Bin340]|nr:MAG: hypothetical protein BWY56_00247 [Acidobacteria bacterium ADurb.Bin340]